MYCPFNVGLPVQVKAKLLFCPKSQELLFLWTISSTDTLRLLQISNISVSKNLFPPFQSATFITFNSSVHWVLAELNTFSSFSSDFKVQSVFVFKSNQTLKDTIKVLYKLTNKVIEGFDVLESVNAPLHMSVFR